MLSKVHSSTKPCDVTASDPVNKFGFVRHNLTTPASIAKQNHAV